MKLSILLVTAFVDIVGLFIVIPLMPYYARALGASGLMVAVLVSSFTAAQLLSAPLWGRVSDHYGRRPALLLGLGMAALAYFVFAYATSLWLLVLSRVVQGAGGGTTGIVQAYVADTIAPHAWAKALGWVSAATNVGVALGPLLGAFAWHRFGQPGPGFLAAILCILNLLFAWRFLGESRERRDAKEATRPRGASMVTLLHVLVSLREPAPRLMWMYAIAIGVFQGMLTVLTLFLADTFGVGPNAIWIVYTYFGFLAVVARAGILGWVVDRYGEVTVSRMGLILLAIGLAGFPFMPTYGPLAVVIALVPLGAAFTFPCVTALLLGGIHRGERGVYLGMQQTLGGIGRVVIPLWAGFAYDHLGHRVPFWTSAALVGGVLVLGLGIEELRTRELGLAIPDGESAAAAGVDNAGVKIGVSGRATLNGGHTLCYASCNALPDISA